MKLEDVEAATNLASSITELRSKKQYFDEVLATGVYGVGGRITLALKNEKYAAWLEGSELPESLLNDVMAVIYTHFTEKEKELLEQLAAL